MGTLKEFLAVESSEVPEKGTVGKESDWLHLCDFELKGKRFLVCDANFMPSEDDGVVVEAPSGKYTVSAKAIDYGGDRRVSRLRVALKGTKPELGDELGETWTDTAVTGISDVDVFGPAWEEVGEDEGLAKLEEYFDELPSCGVFDLGEAGALMPHVDSGFGDGTYPVVELVENGRRVGFEIEFVEPETPYPFGDGEQEEESESESEEEEEEEGGEIAAQAFEMFGKMLEQFGEKRTGNKDEDRANLREMMENFMDQLKGEATKATDEFKEHLLHLREQAFPLFLKLVPASDDTFASAPEVLEAKQTLLEAGFQKAGRFELEKSPQVKMLGFARPENGTLASVVHTGGQTFVTLNAFYEDGTSFELSSGPSRGWESPAWLRKEHREGMKAGELLKIFEELAPNKPRKKASVSEYASRSEAEYSRYQVWLADRGGLNERELKPMMPPAEDEEERKETLKLARHDQAEQALFNWLRMQKDLPFDPEEVMSDLVIVHDDLDADLLVNAWWCATGEFDVKAADFEEGTARDAFAEVNRRNESPLKLVLQKTTGLAADYYLPA